MHIGKQGVVLKDTAYRKHPDSPYDKEDFYYNKNIFLFKLFIALGIETASVDMNIPELQQIRTDSIDQALMRTLDARTHCVMNTWLRACLAEHVELSALKTGYFKSRIV